jgi:hypothetical protein
MMWVNPLTFDLTAEDAARRVAKQWQKCESDSRERLTTLIGSYTR